MKTNTLKHTFTIVKGKEKTIIKLSLADDCKNGHEDFSLTADIYERSSEHLQNWKEAGGGCCHEHILALRPDLATFAALHLATFEGVPMHAFANAWYWFQGAFPESADCSSRLGPCHGGTGNYGKSPEDCRRIFGEHIRGTEEDILAIASQNPRSQMELQAAMEDLGFPARWKAEAQAAIKQLEEWTGHIFESKATRGRFEPLSDEQKKLIREHKESGYYLPENVAKRDEAKKQEVKAKKRAELQKDYDKALKKLNQDFRIDCWLAENFDEKPNLIWYSHANELAANWSSCSKLLTREDFDKITASIPGDLFDSPPVFKFQERPKY